MAYAWISQNFLLAISSAYKNALYISEFSLTYKRIGVFVYLLLAIIGLVTTYQKLRQKRTLWYLFHVNSWCLIILMLLSIFVPWDHVITRYNLNKGNDLDLSYLNSLSEATIPALLPYLNNGSLSNKEQRTLDSKIKHFNQNKKDRTWLSWNYQHYLIDQALQSQPQP